MKKIRIPIFVMMVALIATSCNIAVERHPLMAYQKNMIPYKKGQKVRFTNEKGDTVLFTTKDVITEWVEDEMAIIKVWEERLKVNLQSESGDMISVDMYYPVDYEYYNDPSFSVIVMDLHFSLLFDCKGLFYTTNQQYVYDSLSFNDKTYYDIVLNDHGSTKLYYNKAYGVLQVIQDGKNLLTLQE